MNPSDCPVFDWLCCFSCCSNRCLYFPIILISTFCFQFSVLLHCIFSFLILLFFPLFFCESNFFFGFSFLFVCSLSLSLSLSLGISLAADALPVPLCLLCTWPMLLQLSASASAYDSPASDDLSSNQSMSFSASNSAQPFPCLDSEPPPRSGAARQVSADRRTGNVSGLILRSGQLVFFFLFFCTGLSINMQKNLCYLVF